MILVVLGHALSDTMLNKSGSNFPRLLFDFIYSFHMPLFFFLSGFCGTKVLKCKGISEKKNYIFSRFQRLMVPYFFVGLLYIPIKRIMVGEVNSAVSLRSLPANFIAGINPNYQLWTLYALFIIATSICLLHWRGGKHEFLLILSGVMCILSVFIVCPISIVNHVLSEFFFYMCGIVCRQKMETQKRPRGKLPGIILAFVALFVLNVIKELTGVGTIRILTGIVGIVAICELSKRLEKQKTPVLDVIGRYSMDIYIMANLVQVLIRSVCLGKMQLPGIVCCALSTVLGISLPIIVSKYVVRKVKITRMLILGDFARI